MDRACLEDLPVTSFLLFLVPQVLVRVEQRNSDAFDC